MTQFVAVIVIAVLASSAVAVGISMMITGPEGPEGPQGEPGIGFEPTGYISIDASAFHPGYTTDVAYAGGVLRNMDTKTVYFFASVQLPQGATVTNITGYWYDSDSSNNLVCRLSQGSMGVVYKMAEVSSTGSDGYGSDLETTIDYATVDNSQYSYTLIVTIPTLSNFNALEFYSVTIGFEYPT